MTEQNKKIKELVEKGLSYRAIGDALGLTRNAVKSRAIRMRLVHPNRPEQNGKIGSGSSLKGETEMAQAPTQAQLSAFREHCEVNNLPFELWRAFWHKTSDYSSFFVNQEAIDEFQKLKTGLLDDIKKHAPKYQKRQHKITGEHMLVLPMADIHVGKWLIPEETNFRYNVEQACERAKEGVAGIMARAERNEVGVIVVGIGNDILHTDNGKTSTAGTPQDTDGSWFYNFRAARELYVSILEELAEIGQVHLIHVPSNHDWRSGFALSEAIAASFARHPNVSSDITECHRKYFVYGNNLIMFTHGDGAKEKDLDGLLRKEVAEAWARTNHHYIYAGHIHHKVRRAKGAKDREIEKDKVDYTVVQYGQPLEPNNEAYVEYLRSPSPPDGWHHRNGFVNKAAMEGFLHHPLDGQVSRFTHYF